MKFGLVGLVLGLSLSFSVFGEDAPEKTILFAEKFVTDLAATLDASSGLGTDQLALNMEKLSQKLAERAAKIPTSDVEGVISWNEVKAYFKSFSADGKPIQIAVMNYRDAVAAANLRLQNEGIDFIVLTQDESAALIENFRDFVSGKSISVDQLKASSNLVYPFSDADEIKVPVDPEEFSRGMARLREVKSGNLGKFRFIQDSKIQKVEDVPLPTFDAPLNGQASRLKKYQTWRSLVSVPLAAFGGAFGGQFQPPAIASGLTGAALEFQFIKLSPQWARFWNRFGFAGNLSVNAGYCVAVTSVALAVEYLMTGATSMNVKEFFVKSLFMGTATFVASFGAMQIASSRLKVAGAFSEFTRFRLETFSVLFANFGRLVALGTAGMGIEHSVFSLAGINFNPGDLIGWGIQGVYLMAVTIPMWSKLRWGNDALDGQIKANFELASGNEVRPPSFLRAGCNRLMAGLARIYSVKRR